MERISSGPFVGPISFLSNMHVCNISVIDPVFDPPKELLPYWMVSEGEWRFKSEPFRSSEHVYQAFKSDSPAWAELVFNQEFPKKTKVLARKLLRKGNQFGLRPDFHQKKVGIMEWIVREKFFQNPELMAKLIDTFPLELEEHNSWGDSFWGVSQGVGKNHLGKILVNIRAEARGFL